MESSVLPWGRFFSATPVAPHESEPARRPRLEPVAPHPPRKPKSRLPLLLGVALIVALGVAAWSLRERWMPARQAAPADVVRTARAYVGDFERTLRVSGAIAAKNFAAVRAPTMRGGGQEGGRRGSALTLMNLAEAGTTVEAGTIVAEFEYRWLEDHIDDQRSNLTQAESDLEKRRAEIMIARETQAQALRTARAERDKAALDLRTAEVRSEIEAEKFKLALEEAEAALKHLERETELQEIAHTADLRSQEFRVQKDKLHVERHLRDLEKIKTQTPVRGLVVMESIYRGGGQFDQVTVGDEVNPGTFFMRVVDLSQMIVSASVNQVDSQAVRIGQHAQVRLDAYPDLVLPGRVTSVGAMATSGGGGMRWGRGSRGEYVKLVELEISIDGQDPRVIPDLSAGADILLEKQPNSLLIPRSALRWKDDQPFVRVRQGNRFVEREIELGKMSAAQAVVLAGLQEGEEIALEDIPQA